ncbi:hypothetical protein JCM30471_06400 [Desulfuromonas carbonis]
MGRSIGGLLLFLAIAVISPVTCDAASPLLEPERVGLALDVGPSYSPDGVRYHLLTLSTLYDYSAIWRHAAPAALRFKLDASLGFAEGSAVSGTRGVAAAGFMALYYLDRWAGASWRPYGEAGIGLIYTDFQVKDQGLRLNFNPRFGIGCEFGGPGRPWFGAVHAHHVSNGHLHHDNRGINSVVFELGHYF